MANNLYDYLNQFNLGQVVQGIPGVLQGTADFLNRNQIGTRGIKQTPSYYGPAYASAEALGIKPGGLRNYGTGYKEKELAAGAAAERFRPGAGFPGQQAAADPGGTQLPLLRFLQKNVLTTKSVLVLPN